jgi:magnesium chelatase subunit D
MTGPHFPFSAVVGNDDVRLALLLCAVDPGIGGVLLTGGKGTAKTTLARALPALLPDVDVVSECRFSCAPTSPDPSCPDGPHPAGAPAVTRPARLVELPLGATDDRVTGTLDVARVLSDGVSAFLPGLLAGAHRGLLYVDEVNLLADHLVDLLLDAAATGTVSIERDTVSVRHAARFVLVGTMNPEEGELRPQLLDRFGLCVPVAASPDPHQRAAAVRARLGYESDPAGVMAANSQADAALADRIAAARALLPDVVVPDEELLRVTSACAALGVDGLRADVVTTRTAAAVAAWDGRSTVTADDVRTAARLALPHRTRRGPFDPPGLDEDALDDALGGQPPEPDPDPDPDPAGAPPPRQPESPGQRQQSSPPQATSQEPATASAQASDDGTRTPDAPAPQGIAAPPAAAFRPRLLTAPGTGTGTVGRRSRARTSSGRAVGTVPAMARPPELLPSVRALAARTRPGHARPRVQTADLRRSLRSGREANLLVVVLDTSGSMAARRRTEAVTTAVLSLLTDAYRRRDRVALLTMGGRGVTTVLAPTGSVDVAVRRLSDLPVGGRTPLAEGIEAARMLTRREARRDPSRRPLVVLITDGRATAGPDALRRARNAAHALAQDRVASIVIDAEDGNVRLGLAALLAQDLHADHIPLPELAASDPRARQAAGEVVAQVVRLREVA